MANLKSTFSINSNLTIPGIIIGLLLFSTLPKGGNLPWFSLLLSCSMAVSFCLYIFAKRRAGQHYEKAWLSVWLIYTILILVQLLLIPRLVDWNSPEVSILNLTNKPTNTPAIIESWTRFTSYWLISFFASILTKKQIQWSILSILLVFLFQAIYGLAADALGQSTIISIWPKEHYMNSATGSFVNHNHYANYIALAAPLVLGYLIANKHAFNTKYSSTLVYFICVVLFFVACSALFASLSRGGTAAALIGLFILCIVYFFKYLKINNIARTFIIFTGLFLFLSFLTFIEIDDIVKRFERVLVYDLRWEIWDATFDLPLSLWILGSGGGTFADVFWTVHPPTSTKTAYFAHNDYIQLLIEYGIVGTIIIVISLFFWYRKVKPKNIGLLHIACLISILVMALHSIVDFSMHIPANAILFWFIVGLFCNSNLGQQNIEQVDMPKKNRKKRKRKRRYSSQTVN